MVLPCPTVNLQTVSVGCIILSGAFTLLGLTSYSVREVTNRPCTFTATGALSIISGVSFAVAIVSSDVLRPIIHKIGQGAIILPFSFAMILVAFVLWVIAFNSSRKP
ncbi:MAG: hypothetical protein ACTSUQ_10480 [Candidatus Freyarchaeota archaeon]